MNINKLEIKLLKTSEIKEGDVILVKISDYEKQKLSKDNIKSLYEKISQMIKRDDIGIYFFPDNLEISLIKDLIKNNVTNKIITEHEHDQNIKNINTDISNQ
jgi:hypothetical protein